MSTSKLLGGLFDRPLNPTGTLQPPLPKEVITPNTFNPTPAASFDGGCPAGYIDDGYGGCIPDGSISGYCPPGYTMDVSGNCVPDGGTIITVPPILGGGSGGSGSGSGSSSSGSGGDTDVITNNINNAINITDTGIAQVAQAVQDAITSAANTAAQIAKDAANTVATAVSGLANQIWQGVQAALGNIGTLLTNIASGIWQNLKDIVNTIGSNIGSLIQSIKDFLAPILQSIVGVVNTIAAQVQSINDTLITPIITFYNTTVKTIATLTTAIETDLHQGLTGLLNIPSQIGDALGSIDATLNRTVQQLGTVNLATSQSTVTFAGESLPTPFGTAMAKALGGNTLASQIKTTFGGDVAISSETLSQVSAEAINGLGSLLSDILNIITNTFKGSFDKLHTDWTDVGAVFVGLLDGALGLITTITAMGALASPLISAAEQQANTLVPTAKLDPGTVVAAMKRGFLTAQQGLAEIATAGFDSTRTQVLTDLGVFLADVDTALDWWYRGIIADTDLTANMTANGVTSDDQTAIRASSIKLPSINDLQRWLNFGIITQDEFTANCLTLRYDNAQIQAVLTSYLDRESPQTLSQLNGLLNNSSIGYLNSTLNIPVPDNVSIAGSRAGYHPDLTRYIWLSHWQLPSVEQFIQAYFRGLRTLTEVQARMSIANIPAELWDETIQVARPLIPFRSIPTLVKQGLMTDAQAQSELGAHGYDLAHQQILLAKSGATPGATTVAASTTVHTLSLSNARTLWAEQALTDQQYLTILEAHGYTAAMAQLQMQADAITEHIKLQKATLADYTAQVEAGVLDIDTASQQLIQQGFTSAQVSKFQIGVTKALKVSAKHPNLSDLLKFVKAGYITVAQYTAELVAQGWTDPWLSAFTSEAQADAPTSLVTTGG